MNELPTIEEAIETSRQSILTLNEQIQSVNDKLLPPCPLKQEEQIASLIVQQIAGSTVLLMHAVQGLLEGQKKILAELEEVKKIRQYNYSGPPL